MSGSAEIANPWLKFAWHSRKFSTVSVTPHSRKWRRGSTCAVFQLVYFLSTCPHWRLPSRRPCSCRSVRFSVGSSSFSRGCRRRCVVCRWKLWNKSGMVGPSVLWQMQCEIIYNNYLWSCSCLQFWSNRSQKVRTFGLWVLCDHPVRTWSRKQNVSVFCTEYFHHVETLLPRNHT